MRKTEYCLEHNCLPCGPIPAFSTRMLGLRDRSLDHQHSDSSIPLGWNSWEFKKHGSILQLLKQLNKLKYKSTVKLLFPNELNSISVSNVPSRTLVLGVEQWISVDWVCVCSSTTVPPQPEPQKWPEGGPAAWAEGCLGWNHKRFESEDLIITSKYIVINTKQRCLTVADDRSTVHTATKTLLVTQRRSPASIAMTVMVVVAQLVKEHTIKYNLY